MPSARTPSRLLRRAGAAGTLVLVASLALAPAFAAGPAFTLQDSRIGRPTGMAADHERNRYWVVNGAAGQLTAYAVDGQGATLGRFQSLDRVTSVQAVALSGRTVYFGDLGGSRRTVTVLKAYGPVPETTIRAAVSERFSYPDGSKDAAAMAVDSRGRIVVITRQRPKGGIYRAPEQPSEDAVNPLQRVADAPADVTDATFLLDGRLALRSPSTVYLLDDSFKVTAQEAIAGQPDGGALAQRLDGQALLAGGRAVVDVPLKPAGPEPLPTPTPAPTPSSPAVDDSGQESATQQAGTTAAVLAASVVAVLAGLVVLLKR